MADNARGIHVSPGIYTREIDINYAVRSLGITTLGVVGGVNSRRFSVELVLRSSREVSILNTSCLTLLSLT